MLNTKILAGFLTAFIVASLFIVGGASAVEMDVQPDSKNTAGQVMNFHVTLEDISEVEDLTISIGNTTCVFNEDGSVIGVCEGIEVKLLNANENFGYGNFKDFKYKITLQRSVFTPGSYTMEIEANTDQGIASEDVSVTFKNRGKN